MLAMVFLMTNVSVGMFSYLGTFFGMTQQKYTPEPRTEPETWTCKQAKYLHQAQ